MKKIFSRYRDQYPAFILISVAVAILTGIMYFYNPLPFQRYFGYHNPLVFVFCTIILGFFLLSVLLFKTRFIIYKKENLKSVFLSSGIAGLLAWGIIIVDLIVVFPENFNVLLPASLAFYPVMGYVVEIIFHLLPLTLLYFITRSLRTNKEFIIRKKVNIKSPIKETKETSFTMYLVIIFI